MALGIVKYAYDRSSQLIGVIWFAVNCRGPSQGALRLSLSTAYLVDQKLRSRLTT